jgi:hypothetical protein
MNRACFNQNTNLHESRSLSTNYIRPVKNNFLPVVGQVVRMQTFFLIVFISSFAGLPGISQDQKPIDRFKLINRHNVHVGEVDPLSPLSVGNGDFAFTVDVTGMQTFGDFYYKKGIPIETLS